MVKCWYVATPLGFGEKPAMILGRAYVSPGPRLAELLALLLYPTQQLYE